MNDAGAQFAVDAGEIAFHSVQQPVDQGVILVACGRVDDKTFGLIDHQHILVFIDDIQLHFRGHDVHFLGFGQSDADFVADIQFVVFLSGLAAAQHATLFQQLLGAGAAHILNAAGQERIQSLAGNIGS